jgi:hypothetical protein
VLRDDFSEPVKRTLAAHVGHRCSNPDCRALTSGPQEEPAKAVNLGVAAHISAAAPGGPRYDDARSPEQRSGIENGIWLCQNCAKLIDNDPARFSNELLTAWRLVAEHHARYEVGKTALGLPAGAVEDKYVSYEYPEEIGLAPKLRAEGYRLYWAHSHRAPTLTEVEEWEVVEHVEKSGRRAHLKTREPDCEYMILLKKRP